MNQPAIVKPCAIKNTEKVFQQHNCYCVYNADLVKNFQPSFFSGAYWQSQKAITGTAQGRGTTYFIATQAQQWVLRHYYRGGLIGKINHDSYIYTGISHTRAAKEYQLLCTLQTLKLPAPIPVAYQVVKKGLVYHADILTSRIENASDLVAILQEKPLSEAIWFEIGKVIKRFHQHGIYHHDLNSHNLLLDDKHQVWVIDFDRGEQRKIDKKWQESNMQRLLRSFRKEKAKLNSFHWQETNWQQLMQGYQSLN